MKAVQPLESAWNTPFTSRTPVGLTPMRQPSLQSDLSPDDATMASSFSGSFMSTDDPAVYNNLQPQNDADEEQEDPRLLAQLRALLGDPEGTWKCPEQETAVKAIMKKDRDVGVVLVTGSGKTFVALIPALVSLEDEPGITIIVCPLVSVEGQWRTVFKRLKVVYEHWTGPGSVRGDAAFILVSLDCAKGTHFQSAMRIVHQTKSPIRRLFFDEAHLALTERSYRPCLKNGYELRFLPFQLVLMTGTLPPAAELHMEQEFAMYNTEWIRTSAYRPELLIEVTDTVKGLVEASKIVVERLEKDKKDLDPEDKVIVFVPQVKHGHALSTDLFPNLPALPFYHAKCGTPEEKAEMIARWTDQHGPRIMIATVALEAGGDFPHVTHVFHVFSVPHMAGYQQAVGRGGRSGNDCFCIFIPKDRNPPFFGEDQKHDPALVLYSGLSLVVDMFWKRTGETYQERCLLARMLFWSDGVARTCGQMRDNEGDVDFYCSECTLRELSVGLSSCSSC